MEELRGRRVQPPGEDARRRRELAEAADGVVADRDVQVLLVLAEADTEGRGHVDEGGVGAPCLALGVVGRIEGDAPAGLAVDAPCLDDRAPPWTELQLRRRPGEWIDVDRAVGAGDGRQHGRIADRSSGQLGLAVQAPRADAAIALQLGDAVLAIGDRDADGDGCAVGDDERFEQRDRADRRVAEAGELGGRQVQLEVAGAREDGGPGRRAVLVDHPVVLARERADDAQRAVAISVHLGQHRVVDAVAGFDAQAAAVGDVGGDPELGPQPVVDRDDTQPAVRRRRGRRARCWRPRRRPARRR